MTARSLCAFMITNEELKLKPFVTKSGILANDSTFYNVSSNRSAPFDIFLVWQIAVKNRFSR